MPLLLRWPTERKTESRENRSEILRLGYDRPLQPPHRQQSAVARSYRLAEFSAGESRSVYITSGCGNFKTRSPISLGW